MRSDVGGADGRIQQVRSRGVPEAVEIGGDRAGREVAAQREVNKSNISILDLTFPCSRALSSSAVDFVEECLVLARERKSASLSFVVIDCKVPD
mmetsp:Transcript_1443/g.4003  ORF Transcript_1443/g.4003 Transcript_1443/m.4003 type:complete len:94 (+) Transcript_1443:2920-3201(+)